MDGFFLPSMMSSRVAGSLDTRLLSKRQYDAAYLNSLGCILTSSSHLYLRPLSKIYIYGLTMILLVGDKMKVKREIIAGVAAIVAVLIMSYAFASVFVYYPVTVNLSPVNPPIKFQTGNNANQKDLGGGGDPYTSNTIKVDIGSDGASLTLTLHPTKQYNYYKDVSRIRNTDGKAYYITVRVVTAASLPSGSVARLLIYNALSGGTLVANVNLLATGDTSATATIPADAVWRIDLYIYIPEGSTASATSASLQLIYSPSSETPPTVPP
jgi:hypothetical protein